MSWKCPGVWKQVFEYFLSDPFVLQSLSAIFRCTSQAPAHSRSPTGSGRTICCWLPLLLPCRKQGTPSWLSRTAFTISASARFIVDRMSFPILQIKGQRSLSLLRKLVCSPLLLSNPLFKTTGGDHGLHSCDHLGTKKRFRLFFCLSRITFPDSVSSFSLLFLHFIKPVMFPSGLQQDPQCRISP